MNSSTSLDSQPFNDTAAEIAAALDKARAAIKLQEHHLFATDPFDAVDRAAITQGDYSSAKTVLGEYIMAAEQWKTILQTLVKNVEVLEARHIRRERYSAAWWETKHAELRADFEANPATGIEQWLQTYVEALLAWELDLCQWLIDANLPFSEPFASAISIVRTGTQAIQNEDYQQALDMLVYLTQVTATDEPKYEFDELSRALLLIFVGRIYLYKTLDSEVARGYFERAQMLAPNDGRPVAAMGEDQLLRHELAQSVQLFEQSIEMSPRQSHGFLGMGLYFETKQRWIDAGTWYTRAAERVKEEKNPITALSKLLSPASGNAYVALARVLQQEQPQFGLLALDQALKKGIAGEGKYPECVAYELKGNMLQTLDHRADAAKAYYEAGKRFHWRGEYDKATRLFELANTQFELATKQSELTEILSEQHTAMHWYWSEAWRLWSFQPNIDTNDKRRDAINKSLEIWLRVAEREPSSGFYWAYDVRALINERRIGLVTDLPWSEREALWWEAIAYLERGLLLEKDSAHRWAILGRYYRNLMLTVNEDFATEKAVRLDPRSPLAREERLITVTNSGQWSEAETIIKEIPDSAWLKGIKSFIAYHQGYYSEAINLANVALETDNNILWVRGVRAICYELQENHDAALQDYEELLKQSVSPADKNLRGQVAYKLGDLESATQIFVSLLDDPYEAGSAYRNLGLCYFVRGDLAMAKTALIEGIHRANSKPQLDELLNIDLRLLKPTIPPDMRNELEAEVLKRLDEMNRSPIQELENAGRNAATQSWLWIGQQAGLARLYSDDHCWREASDIYVTLAGEVTRFPQAHIGILRGLQGLQNTSDDRTREGRPDVALEQLDTAIALAQTLNDAVVEANLQSRFGYAHFLLGNIAAARSAFAASLRGFAGLHKAGAELGSVVLALLTDETKYQALDDEWRAWEQQCEPGLQGQIEDARRSLARYQVNNQLEQKLRHIFQERNADGTRVWEQEQVEDCTALIIISSVQGQIENLDPTSKDLVIRFLKRAELDTVSGEQFQTKAKAYFDAHPVAEDLVARLAQLFENTIKEANSETREANVL